MGLLFSFFTVVALVLMVFIGVRAAHLNYLFGVIIPYIALLAFIGGIVYRVMQWARIPVPFRIPTTAGQEKSLPWIKQNKIDNPSSSLGVIIRMALEVLLFRSLFRNTRAELRDGPKLSYGSTKWLWAAGLAFHWTFLIILMRHLRLFLEPVPLPITINGITRWVFPGRRAGALYHRFNIPWRSDIPFPQKSYHPPGPLHLSRC